MSGVITREIAEQFLTDVDSVLPFRKDAADLKNFTSLTDDAAEPLSRIKDNIDLSGLTEISVEAAICGQHCPSYTEFNQPPLLL